MVSFYQYETYESTEIVVFVSKFVFKTVMILQVLQMYKTLMSNQFLMHASVHMHCNMLISAHLLQRSAQLGLVLRAGSFSLQPQQQLWFPVGLESQEVDDALPQGLLGRRGHAAVLPVVGGRLVDAAV